MLQPTNQGAGGLGYVQRYVPTYTPLPFDAISQMVQQARTNYDRGQEGIDQLYLAVTNIGQQVAAPERNEYNTRAQEVRGRLAELAQSTDLGGIDTQLRGLVRGFRDDATAMQRAAQIDQSIREQIEEVESPRRGQFLAAQMATRQALQRGEDGRLGGFHTPRFTFVNEGDVAKAARDAVNALKERTLSMSGLGPSGLPGIMSSSNTEGVDPERAFQTAMEALASDSGAQGWMQNTANLYMAQGMEPEAAMAQARTELQAIARRTADQYSWSKTSTTDRNDPSYESPASLRAAARAGAGGAGGDEELFRNSATWLTASSVAFVMPDGPNEATPQIVQNWLNDRGQQLTQRRQQLAATFRQNGWTLTEDGFVTDQQGNRVPDAAAAQFRTEYLQHKQERELHQNAARDSFRTLRSRHASRFNEGGDFAGMYLTTTGQVRDRTAVELRARVARLEADPAHRNGPIRMGTSIRPGQIFNSDSNELRQARVALSRVAGREREAARLFNREMEPRVRSAFGSNAYASTMISLPASGARSEEYIGHFTNHKNSLQAFTIGNGHRLTADSELISRAARVIPTGVGTRDGRRFVQVKLTDAEGTPITERDVLVMDERGANGTVNQFYQQYIGNDPMGAFTDHVAGRLGANYPGRAETVRFDRDELSTMALNTVTLPDGGGRVSNNLEWVEINQIGDRGSERYSVRYKIAGQQARSGGQTFGSAGEIVQTLFPRINADVHASEGVRPDGSPAGPPSGIPSNAAPIQGNANLDRAVRFFREQGWAPHQVAGIVGNLMAESGMRTQARNPRDGRDGSDSIGIAQWNSTRAQALRRFARERGTSVEDIETQLMFVQHELINSPSERWALQALRRSTDVRSATFAFAGFERPRGWNVRNFDRTVPEEISGWNHRQNYGNRILPMIR